jgi:nitrogen fixation NifU-like protein
MSGLDDLYREIILDHYRSPRNRGELESPPAFESRGHNPLCGDEITLFLLVDGDGDDAVVQDVKIGGQGCSISQSSASMMSESIIGKRVGEARAMIRRFRAMMGIDDVELQPGDDELDLGDLEALQGVVKFPVRIKCAVLGWNTLADALDQAASPA